jgi:hypothetical protein
VTVLGARRAICSASVRKRPCSHYFSGTLLVPYSLWFVPVVAFVAGGRVPHPPCPWHFCGGGGVASSSAGLPRTDSLCYMIAQLHDIVLLNRSRVRYCYSTCSHTDSKRSCRASWRSAAYGPTQLVRITSRDIHMSVHICACTCVTRVPPACKQQTQPRYTYLWNSATRPRQNPSSTDLWVEPLV